MEYFIKEEEGGTYAVWYRAPSGMEHCIHDGRRTLSIAAHCQALMEAFDNDPELRKQVNQRTQEIVEAKEVK